AEQFCRVSLRVAVIEHKVEHLALLVGQRGDLLVKRRPLCQRFGFIRRSVLLCVQDWTSLAGVCTHEDDLRRTWPIRTEVAADEVDQLAADLRRRKGKEAANSRRLDLGQRTMEANGRALKDVVGFD